jgi:hypothetical protein
MFRLWLLVVNLDLFDMAFVLIGFGLFFAFGLLRDV